MVFLVGITAHHRESIQILKMEGTMFVSIRREPLAALFGPFKPCDFFFKFLCQSLRWGRRLTVSEATVRCTRVLTVFSGPDRPILVKEPAFIPERASLP